MSTVPRLHSARAGRAAAALVLAAFVGTGGAAGAGSPGARAANPAAAPGNAPLHAFGWPASGVPNDPHFVLQTELAAIDVAPAWARTTGSGSVIVAVLDTGLDATNSEFAGRVVPGYNALTRVADEPAGFGPTADDSGHGTHVSGTIAAAANNAVGIAGIAPLTAIMPVKVLDSMGAGDFASMVDGLEWAVAHGASIVTLSLGGELPAELVPVYQRAFDAANASGVVVVAAAGNDGTTVAQYPCSFAHVICVGSTTNDGSAVSSFSNRTPALALVAPGEQIVSTLPDNVYQYWSGTSMAAPHVTATVALMRAIDPSIGVDAVTAGLEQTAKPLVGGGRNPDSGFGLLQVGAAVALAATGLAPLPTPTPDPSVEPTPDPSVEPTPTPIASPTPAPDPLVSPTPTPTPDASPTPDPMAGPTPSPAPDVSPVLVSPTITRVTPRAGSRSVGRSFRPRVTFSVPMTGISNRTIILTDITLGRRVTIRVTYSAATRTATLIPSVRLAANHGYRISVTNGVAALGGWHLVGTFTATFRTGLR